VASWIGDSQGEAPKVRNEDCDITIRDIPTSSAPSIVRNTCQEILKSQGSTYQDFEDEIHRHRGIATHDILNKSQDSVGPRE
jgi:hypothetical protein